jgi:hypothetical protein
VAAASVRRRRTPRRRQARRRRTHGWREGGRGGVEREDERTPYLFLSKTVENIIKRDIFCGHDLCASTNLKAGFPLLFMTNGGDLILEKMVVI